MSVLVEFLTVVVPRRVLDVSYPGGADGYIAHLMTAATSRWRCADDDLVAAAYLHDTVDAALDHLAGLGMIHVNDGECVDIAVIDDSDGPTMPCDWIAWERDARSVTRCWMACGPDGWMATPPGWEPRDLRHTERRDDPRMIKLGVTDGVEEWLDTATGGTRCWPEPIDSVSGSVMLTFEAAMVENDIPYRRITPRVAIATIVAGALRCDIRITVDERYPAVDCVLTYPLVLPADQLGDLLQELKEANEEPCIRFESDDAQGTIGVWIMVELFDGYSLELAWTILDEVRLVAAKYQALLLQPVAESVAPWPTPRPEPQRHRRRM